MTIRLPRRLTAPAPGWTLQADVVVVGSGVAGLTTALHARAAGYRVLLVTKAQVDEGSTRWAQGGIAAALADDDSPADHERDTLVAGAGLCDPEAVRALVTEGPDAVRRLIALGARFDTDESGDIALTREGGHLRDRIAHAGGDATGAEISRALVAAVAGKAGIELDRERARARPARRRPRCRAGPDAARDGRGPARRRRRGARSGGRARHRRSRPGVQPVDEPVRRDRRRRGARAARRRGRGRPRVRPVPPDGAVAGRRRDRASSRWSARRCAARARCCATTRASRFMEGQHPLADLAPRDVVAKAIMRRMRETGAKHVWLDAREFGTRDVGDAVPDDPRVAAPDRHRPLARPHPGRTRAALRLGRRAHRRATAARACAGCTPSASARARACTAPTGSPPTRCSRVSCSRRGSATCSPRASPSGATRSLRSAPDAVLDAAARRPLQAAMTEGVGVLRSRDSMSATLGVLDAVRSTTTGRPAHPRVGDHQPARGRDRARRERQDAQGDPRVALARGLPGHRRRALARAPRLAPRRRRGARDDPGAGAHRPDRGARHDPAAQHARRARVGRPRSGVRRGARRARRWPRTSTAGSTSPRPRPCRPSSARRMDLVARGTGVAAGIPVAAAVFDAVSGGDADGDGRARGRRARRRAATCCSRCPGRTRDLLTAERTALNLLCHLSGVATATARVGRRARGHRREGARHPQDHARACACSRSTPCAAAAASTTACRCRTPRW